LNYPLAGWLYKWLNRQLMLAFFVFLLTGSVALIPHYGHLSIALVALCLNGIGDGGYDAGSSSWLVEMLPEGNSIFLQASQFMYGLGSIVAPMMVAPYVYGEALVDRNNQTLTVDMRKSGLSIPFGLNGLMQGIGMWILLDCG